MAALLLVCLLGLQLVSWQVGACRELLPNYVAGEAPDLRIDEVIPPPTITSAHPVRAVAPSAGGCGEDVITCGGAPYLELVVEDERTGVLWVSGAGTLVRIELLGRPDTLHIDRLRAVRTGTVAVAIEVGDVRSPEVFIPVR